jgi:hypothetical protein
VVVAVYGVYVVGSDRTQHDRNRGMHRKNSAHQRGWRLEALRGIELEDGSFQTVWGDRSLFEGALGGEEAEALVSPQREALTGLAAAGAAGWDALLALSVTKARFVGKDSIKLNKAEEVMIAVYKLQKIYFMGDFRPREWLGSSFLS